MSEMNMELEKWLNIPCVKGSFKTDRRLESNLWSIRKWQEWYKGNPIYKEWTHSIWDIVDDINEYRYWTSKQWFENWVKLRQSMDMDIPQLVLSRLNLPLQPLTEVTSNITEIVSSTPSDWICHDPYAQGKPPESDPIKSIQDIPPSVLSGTRHVN